MLEWWLPGSGGSWGGAGGQPVMEIGDVSKIIQSFICKMNKFWESHL